MESSGCGSRGETLFDHQFLSSRKQSERRFLAAFSYWLVLVNGPESAIQGGSFH